MASIFKLSQDGGSHDSKRMVRFLTNWACQLGHLNCLEGAKENFEKVASGEKAWEDIDVNARDFSRNYAIRNGDPDDIQVNF